jgi:hypothetical protein
VFQHIRNDASDAALAREPAFILGRLRDGIASIADQFDVVLPKPPRTLGMISPSVLRTANALLISAVTSDRRRPREATGASRAAVRRNLVWMEDEGSIREVTGQGRFRMWRVSMPRSFPPSDAD